MLSVLIFSTAFATAVLGIPQAPAVTPAPSLAARQCAMATHVVRPGDTLSRIAAQLNVGICNIAKSNHIINPNTIYASQTLTVRASGCEPVNNGPACTVEPKLAFVHTAVAGDTFWNLAVAQGIPVSSILLANPAVQTGSIPIGFPIVVPAAL